MVNDKRWRKHGQPNYQAGEDPTTPKCSQQSFQVLQMAERFEFTTCERIAFGMQHSVRRFEGHCCAG